MQLINDQYQIQGLNVLDICKKYDTPIYIYDGEKIISQFNTLKAAFGGLNIKIKYAAKALTNQSILKLLRKAGSGIDVVSIQELQLGMKAGFTPTEIMFTPNCVSFEEIQEAIKLGVTLNIDNLPFLERFGQIYENSYPCCIRINPHINAGGNVKIMTGHKGSKFGISVEQLEEIYALTKKYNIKVIGLHVHSGSDFKDADAFVKAADIIFDIAKNFRSLTFLDFGSGFKVAYKEGDYSTNINELGEKMKIAFSAFCKSYGRELEIWFEPGKYLVSESGYLIVGANVVKPTPAATFIGVNSGLNHLIRPMMYGAYHGMVNLSNPKGAMKEYTVVGYICETDTFGTDIKLNEVREADVIAIKNAGAYGFSMSSNYNSRLRPPEVLVVNGAAKLIRKRESFDDLLKNQIEIEI
ncbi:MAG TPA: diaminopimelate decarboxylase [Cytophagaceae bacterium]|jgi:diaminopimelate decarboxylase|nr:diaminopimelate decarboxylase [Cytophagaceae bacterium]